MCGLLFLALGKPFICDYILLGNCLLTSVLQLDALCSPCLLQTSPKPVYMLIVFIVFLIKSTPISTSHLEGRGRRSSFTNSIRNPLPLPSGSQGRVQLWNELGLHNVVLPACWHGKHWVFVPLWLVRCGLAASGVTDAAGGQELEPAEGFGTSVWMLQDHWGFPRRDQLSSWTGGTIWKQWNGWPAFHFIVIIQCMTTCGLHWIRLLLPDIWKAGFLQGFLSIDP